MGFLVMIPNYIINGKFSVFFHDIIPFGLLSALIASFPCSSLFIFPIQILFELIQLQFVSRFQIDLSGPLSCFATL